MKISNQFYDFLSRLVRYILPGLGTFYFTLSGIWDLPYAEQVVGTLAAVATLIGVLVGISKKRYQGEGEIFVEEESPTTGGLTLSVDTANQLAEIKKAKQVTLKVTKV